MMSADSVSPAELARYVRCNSCVRVLLYSYLRGTICSRLSAVGTLLYTMLDFNLPALITLLDFFSGCRPGILVGSRWHRSDFG